MSINNQREEDDQFRRVFGDCDITEECVDTLNRIKNNHPNTATLYINSNEEIITELGWRLLGGYIAKNTHLTEINIESTNVNASTLFELLVRSSSIRSLRLGRSVFGVTGESICPFLENSPQLISLSIINNNDVNSECFQILISALHNRGIKKLILSDCNITNISALETNNLPNLNTLSLAGCNIGREGCIVISNQLQKEGSKLRGVYLNNTGMGDEEVELLATSLKHNNKLELITLVHGEGITERRCVAFLKLLNDVSSIENTYRSNHTLKTCIVSTLQYNTEMRREGRLAPGRGALILIDEACKDNRAIDAGKAKVIRSHLNSQTLKKLCELQGIEYTPGSIFADIEPVLLPDILALIRSRHGQSELYTALIHTAPNLLSYIDRKALIDRAMTKNTAQATALSQQCAQKVAEYEQKIAEYEQKIAALKTNLLSETSRLTAENNDMKNRRTLIDVEDSRQSTTGDEGCGGDSRGKKRGRS